jgi:hypothetical protein
MEVNGTPNVAEEERAIGTHWRGGWVGPGASVFAVVKKKNLTHSYTNRDTGKIKLH